MCTASDISDPIKELYNDTKEGLLGEQKPQPRPDLERLKAETEAANVSNAGLAADKLRKRKAAGRVAGDSVLAGGAADAVDSTILGSGGKF